MKSALPLLCTALLASTVVAAPPEVAVIKPVEREITDIEDFAGRTDASATAEIRCRLAGNLQKVHSDLGSEVKKGDLLFELDDRLQKAELAKAEALVAQAKA